MIGAVGHASHYDFGNLSRAPFYQVVDAERVDHFAGSFVPFVPFFLHNLEPPIISCSELVVSCLANLGGEWLWGQLWTWRQWPSDSFWGRRANSLRSTTQTQVAFWGFQDSIPTSGLRRHIRVYRSRRFWELLSLGSICRRRPHLQMFICFWSISMETNLYHLDHRSDVKENRRQHIEYSLLLFSTWYPPHFLTILLTHGLSGACWLTHCWLTLTVACQSTPCLLTPSSQHRNMAFRALRKSSVRGWGQNGKKIMAFIL